MTETDIPTGSEDQEFDVIIIGAGVNGAGLFRDLSLQGIDCLLIDKGDFGSGTSAAPSRLIHGGIKYLETGELGLVAQSTYERNLLLRNAPHCVEPLPTFIPSFSWFTGAFAALRTLFGSTTAPRSRGALLIKIGLALYDFYGARKRVMPRHRFFLRAAALREMPEVTPRIVAGGIYYDAKVNRPERLVYELVADGCAAHPGSQAHNHVTLEGREGASIVFCDHAGQRHRARGRIVINAAGPWIDRVNETLGETTAWIGGTKGSHILLDHPKLVESLKGRMIYFEADDGRICLVFDYLGLALVGSTDIKASDPDHVRCEDDEIDYFLASLRMLLPGLSFDRSQIVYTYSGIRPLPASDAANPGLISRDHSAPVLEPSGQREFPIIAMVGGKWTTFRGFSEEVADDVLKRLERTRRVNTADLAIGGGAKFPEGEQARAGWIAAQAEASGHSQQRVSLLLDRYGTTADAILSHAAQRGPAGTVAKLSDYLRAEIDWIARHEHVRELADLVMRRMSIAIEGKLTLSALADIASIAGSALGWDPARQSREIEAVRLRLSEFHGMELEGRPEGRPKIA